ncbi:hypothetical protein GS966_25445 [Rhodococcus hoagii]|nr:hypothetical protein [Prescottella equi]NKS61648.1 hypothetical protein [Prescottella equi]NKZ93247.1 hypothetical protein [Prescottella equi]
MREATNMHSNANTSSSRRPATTPRPIAATAQPDRPSKTDQIHATLFSHYQR